MGAPLRSGFNHRYGTQAAESAATPHCPNLAAMRHQWQLFWYQFSMSVRTTLPVHTSV